ncbi:MAG: DUF1015 domain-containing protein [Flavobacteriaceae bacterium]|nr:DUF1015 domain-containing protein [Flavobacteriaceae bacterium]
MAVVKPFKAVRPAPDKVAHVVSRSYENYGKKELKAHLKFNPFSFLHIINPGFKFDQEISGKQRFKLVRNRYLEFLEDGIFLQDDSPAYYIYQLSYDKFNFRGFFAATAIDDYNENHIKKHEDTIKAREILFKDYLKIVGFNAEPVLMTYADNAEIKSLMDVICADDPTYFFTSTDKKTHRLWRVDTRDHIQKIEEAFACIPDLYIADGHHRSASSALLSQEIGKDKKAANFFMSYLLPESEIFIDEFTRMVKDLNGLSKEDFLMQLDTYYRIENRGEDIYHPTKKHHFSMYLDGEFYSLYLRKTVYEFDSPLSELDPQLLYDTILNPILGIKNLRTDKRISYGHGQFNVLEMKNNIDKKQFAVGFSYVPINMEEIKTIADASLVMPPKSTYILPKLRSGLTIYDFS